MVIFKQSNSLFQIWFFLFVFISLISSIPSLCLRDLSFSSFKEACFKNSITQYEKRFSGVKTLLVHEAIVGYTDEEFKPINYLDARVEPYYLTQYALAPLVLEPNIKDYKYILGNFKKNFNYQNTLLKNGLFPSHDFGNGVVLFQKRRK